MRRFPAKTFDQGGYTVLEAIAVTSIFTVVIGAVVSLMQVSYLMDRQAQDGFAAQNEGRRVLSRIVALLRPAQNLSADNVPIIHALNDGTVIDVKIDSEKDGEPEIARFRLDQAGKRIVLYLDAKDENGFYNYQAADEFYPDWYGLDEPAAGAFDTSETIAGKVVNAPPDGSWDAQIFDTDPNEDYRLFTFYGEDFDDPLDTVAEVNWNKLIRGVKIYIWSDIQPAEIPSPFGIQTDVHLRNIQGE